MNDKEVGYTLGPWEIHNNIGRKGELGILSDKAPCIIAVMGNQKEWPLEARANARLIAAAPEMFNALKLVLNCQNYTTDSCPVSYELQAALTEARAAIARAETR